MISLVRNVTFYLVAWLCLSGFLVPFSIVAATTTTTTTTTGTATATATATATTTTTTHPCFPPVGKFCTYNQNQFGKPNSPANSVLTRHFLTLFPRGITIGADVYLNLNNLLCSVLDLVSGLLDTVLDLVFYTVDDVVAFLPQVGTPGKIIEPATAHANSLAGNTLALALNIALDANVALFSRTSACNLTDLYVVSGPCAGLSVAVVLNIANQLLGQTCPLPILGKAPLTIAANIDVCVANINNNFLAGAAAHGFLALPGLNLKAIVDVCLSLPAITANVDASLVLKGAVAAVGAPLKVDLKVGAKVSTFNAWKLGVFNLAANSPVPVSGLVLPLPSVVDHLLAGVLSLVDNLLDVVLDDTLCLVNYLLNNKPLNARLVDIQAAILLLLNPGLTVQALLRLGFPCNPQLVLAILADVRLNGVGFIPASNQIVGVVANVKVGGVAAKVLLELNVPAIGLDVDADLCIAL